MTEPKRYYDTATDILDYVDDILDAASNNIHYSGNDKEPVDADELSRMGDENGFQTLVRMLVNNGLLDESTITFPCEHEDGHSETITEPTYTVTLKGLEWLERHRARNALLRIADSLER